MEQVTSKTPATKQKNPKRVAAGKATAEKTKMARAAQKKALIEAQSIIANQQTDPPDTPSADPPSVDTNKKRSHNNAMAEHHQHCSFIGWGLLQTRRDQERFCQKDSG